MNFGFRIAPVSASTLSSQVDLLTVALLILCLGVLIGVLIVIFYFIIRYRDGSHFSRPKPFPENSFLGKIKSYQVEILWSSLPMILFTGLFVCGAYLFYEMHDVPADATDVYVVGKQWMWKFEHPNGIRELNELHVPVGEPIRLVMTSQDVIHSFFVPAFRMKQDVLPGRYTYTWFQATRPGVYHLFCTQYCGLDHALMGGNVTVLSKADYEQWLTTGSNHVVLKAEGAESGGIVSRGKKLYQSVGCIACHGENSPQRAPRLTGISGSKIVLRNGETVIADENYFHEKLINPYAKDLPGYEGTIMPSFAHLPEEDLMALVSYLKAGAPESEKGP